MYAEPLTKQIGAAWQAQLLVEGLTKAAK